MYFSATIISVKAVEKLLDCRSIMSFPSQQVAATILATFKPYVVPAIARKNIISMQGSIDVLVKVHQNHQLSIPAPAIYQKHFYE
jgi:hypothetical protein